MLSDYTATVGNWRLQLQKNERKTRLVMLLFFLVYLLVGGFVDVFILHLSYPSAPIRVCCYALLTLQVVPYATLLMVLFALISILITYAMYDRIMLLGTEYHEVTGQSSSLEEKQLYHVVEEMKVAAGLRYMPKVFIIEANYMNAFASGYSEKSAMVAITRGLLQKLDRAELQAVMAHELSHVRHHDIKLTLMVAVLSNILLIVVDMLFYSILFRDDRRDNNNGFFMAIIILRYVLPLITVVLTLFLSRTREFMADAGAVELMRDNEPMARALLKITADHEQHAEQYQREYGQTPHEQVRHASYLFDPSDIDPVKSLTGAFSTHPSTEKRLRALGFLRNG